MNPKQIHKNIFKEGFSLYHSLL